MILHRRRKLLPQLASQLTEHLRKARRLDHEGSRYFELLVLYSQGRSNEEKEFYASLLSTVRPQASREFIPLELDRYRAIADWHHAALLEMVRMKDFKPDPKGLSLGLGGNVKPTGRPTACTTKKTAPPCLSPCRTARGYFRPCQIALGHHHGKQILRLCTFDQLFSLRHGPGQA